MSDYIRVKIDNVLKGFNSKIPFMQPLYETITNSLEAHAKDIRIVFEKEELLDNDTMNPRIIGFTITTIRDVTPIPHNGCRLKKRRRV